ncbi:MAG: FtsW/RodA/SpoVE family cell cycle protein, partial [Candidatus Marinimicrobia bacterium]|nr:FtsW/RodA/SpoVE family cell cycle protein [Candidatus Neomarinimicrobiota bacterium]
VIGVTSVLFFHAVINVAMTIGLMPVTGLPLPFLSYGGSFIITCFLMIGLVFNLSVDRHR